MFYLEFLGNPDILSLALLLFALYLIVVQVGGIPGGTGAEPFFGFPDFPFVQEGVFGLAKLAMAAIVLYFVWPLLFYQQLLVFLAIIAVLAFFVHRFFGFDYSWSLVAGLLLLMAFTSNGLVL